MIRALSSLLVIAASFAAADVFGEEYDKSAKPADFKTNLTTGGPYTYSQSAHHFYGVAYDGSMIDTYGACAGNTGILLLISSYFRFNLL